MKTLVHLRSQLGLSQQEMARLLGTSRSRLSHAEAGTRMLEGKAMMQVARLLAMLQEQATAGDAPAAVQEDIEEWEWHRESCRLALHKLHLQYRQQEAKQQSKQLLAGCADGLLQLQEGKTDDRQTRLLAELSHQAKQQKHRASPSALWRLQLRIIMLEYEIGICDDVIQTGTFRKWRENQGQKNLR